MSCYWSPKEGKAVSALLIVAYEAVGAVKTAPIGPT